MENTNTDLAQRALHRRASMVGNRALKYEDAERWDLAFWQKQTPQDRLSALVAIHRDIDHINHSDKKQP